MKHPIVFIHGLFQNPASWQHWMDYFSERGFDCLAPAYPFHAGDPAALRANPDPDLARLTFSQVMKHLEMVIAALPQPPIVIGHSMGGLAVQTVLNRGKVRAAIAIDSAPPRGIISLQWSFLRANFPTVNPLKGNSICVPSVDWFHYAFCNTLSLADTQTEYDKYVVPESRNIPRSSTGRDGRIDFARPHAPLLFIAGGSDTIIPPALNRKNARAYTDTNSRVDFHEFPGRGHYICGQPGWQEVAEYCLDWIDKI